MVFLHGLSGILVAPFIGAISDGFGARRIVPSLFAIEVLVLAWFRYLDAAILGYWIRYCALAVLCMGTTQVAFSRIISSWFSRRLGLAIGISLAGVGVGGFIWSLLLQYSRIYGTFLAIGPAATAGAWHTRVAVTAQAYAFTWPSRLSAHSCYSASAVTAAADGCTPAGALPRASG